MDWVDGLDLSPPRISRPFKFSATQGVHRIRTRIGGRHRDKSRRSLPIQQSSALPKTNISRRPFPFRAKTTRRSEQECERKPGKVSEVRRQRRAAAKMVSKTPPPLAVRFSHTLSAAPTTLAPRTIVLLVNILLACYQRPRACRPLSSWLAPLSFQ